MRAPALRPGSRRQALLSPAPKCVPAVTAIRRSVVVMPQQQRDVPALIEALNDTEACARAEAARALGRIGGPDAVLALANALQDVHPGVRADAATALGVIGDKSAVPALSEAVRDAHADVRRQAAWALDRIGD